MDQGGWFSNVSGPSPDLEAVWGPDAAAHSRRPVGAEHGGGAGEGDLPHAVAPPLDPSLPVVPSLVAPRRGPRRTGLIAVAAAVLMAIAGAGAMALTAGGDTDRTVRAAATPTVPPVSDEQADNAQAFLERWNAGPSTTMPLGEAGVPPEE